MRKIIVLSTIIYIVALFSGVRAQMGTPPRQSNVDAEGNKIRDRLNDVKNRSIELERLKRDSNKPAPREREAGFPEIKEDFEQIQTACDDVVKIYRAKGAINYQEIAKSAREIRRRAKRLRSNLFPAESENKKDKKELSLPVSRSKVKSLIIVLHDAIGSFTSSPIFQNLKLVDPKDSAKAETDLEQIIKVSAALEKSAAEDNR